MVRSTVKENGGGKVHHVERDKELSHLAKELLTQASVSDVVEYHVGEALEQLKNVKGIFDIIFCDIDKDDYPNAWLLMRERIVHGGIAIFHNMLYDGGVLEDNVEKWLSRMLTHHPHQHSQQSRRTGLAAVKSVTEHIIAAPEFIMTLNPVDDGLMVVYKI